MKSKQCLPPRLAEYLLVWLDAPDYIIGDFIEGFEQVMENGRIRANIWYWQQLFRSTPAFWHRRWQATMKTLTKRDKQLFVFGVFAIDSSNINWRHWCFTFCIWFIGPYE
jgi:hypothetical protein